MSSPPKPATERKLIHTQLHDVHQAAGGRMVAFAGYWMPVRYGSQVEEHHAVRKAAGLFDVSHMGEVFVEGAQAVQFLQRLTPNNVAKLAVGQAHYSALLNAEACFIDDLLIYRLGEEEFLLVVNADGRTQDVKWIREQAKGYDVQVDDRSDDIALLALQGPKAFQILQKLCDQELSSLQYYRSAKGTVAGHETLISRTGYTGEDGFELYVANDVVRDLWQRILEAGAPSGIVPAGLAARDTLRLEAGMLLSGQDIDSSVTPIEAGVGWFVKLKKGVACIGAEVLGEQRRLGVRRRLIGFQLEGRAMARTGYRIEVGGINGVVTSGSWSPTLEKSIGIARIESDLVIEKLKPGVPVVAEIRRSQVNGVVASLPFYSRPQ